MFQKYATNLAKYDITSTNNKERKVFHDNIYIYIYIQMTYV